MTADILWGNDIALVYQLNIIRSVNNKLKKMALRIGAFLLASYNFVSAHLIDHGYVKAAKYSALYGGDRPEPTPAPGIAVKDYVVGAKNCIDNDCHPAKKVIVAKRPAKVVVAPKKVIVAARPDVVVRRCRDRRSGSCRRRRRNTLSADRYININRQFADFKQIDHADRDDYFFAKAHNTIVGSKLISSVGDTEHKVSKNYNADRSNLPEHRYYKNYRAKKELLGYDNLLKTAVKPVKDVSVELKDYKRRSISRDNDPLKYKIVVPGRLEKRTFKQVVKGELRENANPVITDFGVARERSRPRSRSDRKFYKIHKAIRNITVSKEKPKKIVIEKEPVRIHPDLNEKQLKSFVLKKDEDDSNYWLGLRPGKWYDAKRKDYVYDYSSDYWGYPGYYHPYYYGYGYKRYHSADAKYRKVIVKEDHKPQIIKKVIKEYKL